MLIMLNSDNKKRGKARKCENWKDSLDLHGVIADSKMVVLFEYE